MKNMIFNSTIVTLTSSAKADCPSASGGRKPEGMCGYMGICV